MIEKYQKLWGEHKIKNPSDIHVEELVRSVSGYFPRYGDKLENYPVLCIPITELDYPKDDWWFLEV
ncbi:MAG: hypothetical protein GTN38_01770, partial [Candidatus Aenigmarchaeota archaeon]|nr:hypothetical protein [Candidatus Aenigmarchaeota archaeon]